MSRLRTLRRRMDAASQVGARRRSYKTGTIHTHDTNPVQKNWQGREFRQCKLCGAIFFLDA